MIPDIGVLGPYTYLATEVVFGSLAAVLLWYSGAWRKAAITVAALYPVGYVWDWYTLEVGVFEIPLRTGLEVLGIPLEEHIFMIVVPAVVIGAHETIHGKLLAGSPDETPGPGSGSRDPDRSADDATRERAVATDGDGDLPTCPVCGRPYEMRYARRAFRPPMADADDELCRTDRFVHVHEHRDGEGSAADP